MIMKLTPLSGIVPPTVASTGHDLVGRKFIERNVRLNAPISMFERTHSRTDHILLRIVIVAAHHFAVDNLVQVGTSGYRRGGKKASGYYGFIYFHLLMVLLKIRNRVALRK